MNTDRQPVYSFEIEPRPARLGGGWRLRLLLDHEEMGGGIFPPDPDQDAAWNDALAEGESWVARS